MLEDNNVVYVKENLLGFSKCKDKKDAEGVVLSLVYYDNLLNELSLYSIKYNNDVTALQKEKNHLEQAFSNKCNEIDEVKSKLNNQINTIRNLENELASLKRSNESLIRIIRERENAAAGLIPKKAHTGYCMISTLPKEIKYKEGANIRSGQIWETTFQTFYDLDFNYSDVYEKVIIDLTKGKADIQPLLALLGFNNLNNDASYDYIFNNKKIDECYKLIVKSVNKKGFWDVSIQHLKPIENFPSICRSKRNNQKKIRRRIKNET